MYVFPGLGLGAILSRASSVTDSMVEAASLGLANAFTADERALDMVYPRIERIREISVEIAVSVIRAAQSAVSYFSLAYSFGPCAYICVRALTATMTSNP